MEAAPLTSVGYGGPAATDTRAQFGQESPCQRRQGVHVPQQEAPAEKDGPWCFGPEPVYLLTHGAQAEQALHSTLLDPPESVTHVRAQGKNAWHAERRRVLSEWGHQREAVMHRPPMWCMDQLCSGSGLYPPRRLSDEWFDAEELQMASALERLLEPTGHATAMARDMLALRIFDVDVRIIADDSASMNSAMLGGGSGLFDDRGLGRNANDPLRACFRPGSGARWSEDQVRRVFGSRACKPDNMAALLDIPFPPSTPRWDMMADALGQWEEVFKVLGTDRSMYLLNGVVHPEAELATVLRRGPCGGTPMGSTLARVLSDYERTGKAAGRPLLVLVLTDGEANDKILFNTVLDEIQDGLHGDVQVCLMGLSLVPEDIEWFEDEECDDTRIRAIEPFEVERQLILYRKVIQRNSDYTFAMHTFRALLTNYFPGDYDYQAPLQTLRHRLYITLHALDRRITGIRNREGMLGSGTTGGGAAAAGLGGLAALHGGGCCVLAVVGLSVYAMGTYAWKYTNQSQDSDRNGEDSLSDEDSRVIGEMVVSLQALAQKGQVSVVPEVCARSRGGSSFGRTRRSCGVDRNTLSFMQRAILDLRPNEAKMRDLQFQDVPKNNQALRSAVLNLRQAAIGGKSGS